MIIDQIEDTIDYVSAVNTAFLSRKIVNTRFNFVFDTGVFRDECKAWLKLEEANQNWEEFYRMLTQASIELQES